MSSTFVHTIFFGSDGAATRKFGRELRDQGHIGKIAAALFTVQKASSRAQRYRGGIPCEGGRTLPYKDLAYCRKGDFLKQLADLLVHDDCGMAWGWGLDLQQPQANHVLYLDLPQGQVSLHSVQRFAGPDYPGEWDGTNATEDRVIAFCDSHWRGGSSATAAPALPAPQIVEDSSNGENN